jgi:hypothetical protein
LTLSELAKAKGFQIDGPKGLSTWGVAEKKQQGATVVRIPYFDEAGEERAVRFRRALDGDFRFSWRKGDKTLLYGLWRLKKIRKVGWCMLVEGETDCWTCWLHSIPALGIPGKSTWKKDWAYHFRGLQVFLWQEPDAPELPAKIGKDIPELMVIQAPEGIKDLNEAHLRGEDVPALMERLKVQAVPAASIIKAQSDKRLAELREAAKSALDSADPLQEVRQALRAMGFGGDPTPALITYLAATSRLLTMRSGAMPVHLLLVGQASVGKSYVLQIILSLLPDGTHHTIQAGSPRVLIYDDADLQHKAIIFGEADSLPAGEDNPAASAIRNLLQDHHLHYDVTVKNPDTAEYKVKKVRKEGPTVLLTTSTRRLGHQLETRVFSLEVGDSRKKIQAALKAQADIEIQGPVLPDAALVAFQEYLQVQAPWDVVVPFVKPLAAVIARKATAPRILRDFARLISLVKSVAVLRHRHRRLDDKGRLVATIEDYVTIYSLVGPIYEATLSGATTAIRETVDAVIELLLTGATPSETVLAEKLGVNRSTVSRRVKAAIRQGWLLNSENRKGFPWKLEKGEPLPEQEGLPTPDEIRVAEGDCCTVAPVTDELLPIIDEFFQGQEIIL